MVDAYRLRSRKFDVASPCHYLHMRVNPPDMNDALKMRGCTCLRLRKASRRVSQIYDRHLASFGLTVTQYGVLGHVASFDGISIGALAEKLFMDPTTLTRNLSPLQRLNLVAVEPDPRDRRTRRLHVTARGREAFAKAKSGWSRAQRYIERTLGEVEAPALNAVLDRVLERLAP